MGTKLIYSACFFLIVLAGVIFLFYWTKLPLQLPLLYSLPWGEAQLVPKLWFGLGLVVLCVITVINAFVASVWGKTDMVIAWVTGGATLLLILLYLATFFRILVMMV